MPTKEQELTYKNISKFYDLSDKLVDDAHDLTTNASDVENIAKFHFIMSFLEEFTTCTEVLSADYTKIIDCDPKTKEILKKEITQQVVLMALALKNCQNKVKEL